jgi:hypothetical protein
MTIIFTDEEKEWIDKTPFRWTIKKGCPENIRTSLKKKLEALYKNAEE